jgi:glucose-1-phosphatase
MLDSRPVSDQQQERVMKYSVVVFDCFGVVCSEVAPPWLARHFDEAEAARIKAGVIADADRGDIRQEQLFAALSSATGVDALQIEEEWLSLVHIDAEVVGLIERLRGQCKLGLLTNSPAPFVRGIIARHKFAALFDAIVVSAECGFVKPEPDIYRLMLDRLAADADKAILIDDNAHNIDSARAIGMAGELYVGCARLAEALGL